jgi:hypothetical protein
MAKTRAKKQVVILSDDEQVTKVITLTLGQEYQLASTAPGHPVDSPRQSQKPDWDLIILALSSFASEPIVALARASFVSQVGQVPLLIISDRAFQSDIPNRIYHLDFPFTARVLVGQVREIIQGEDSEIGPCNSHPGMRP